MQPIRLNKYISISGLCSRRKADAFIKGEHVFLNGKKAVLGDLVRDGDEVKIGGKIIALHENKVYLAYNKPVGVICTADQRSKNNIIQAVGYPTKIFPVGRLDVATSGLIFLTNDGDFANKLTHPKFKHEKEYLIVIDKTISPEFLRKLKKGVKLQEGIAKADVAEQLGDREFRMVLHQGFNRQIRRMCEELGYQVKSLKRIRIGNIKLGNLQEGKFKKFELVDFNFF